MIAAAKAAPLKLVDDETYCDSEMLIADWLKQLTAPEVRRIAWTAGRCDLVNSINPLDAGGSYCVQATLTLKHPNNRRDAVGFQDTLAFCFGLRRSEPLQQRGQRRNRHADGRDQSEHRSNQRTPGDRAAQPLAGPGGSQQRRTAQRRRPHRAAAQQREGRNQHVSRARHAAVVTESW